MYENLLENSINAVLSSIEIYNKPDFKYREQVFTILNINAWELLLKAKILLDHQDQIESLYISLADGTYKTSRSGNPLTIEIVGAIRELQLNPTVSENLLSLIEIRDTAVHFFHDESIAYAIYTLGVASLKNYQKLIQDWFGRSLLEYNFYILPLGFAFNFQTLSTIDFQRKPTVVANILISITNTQNSLEPSNFHFICEITTQIISAKKFADDVPPDLVTTIDSEAADAVIVQHLQRLTDKYPLTYSEVVERIRKAKPDVNQNHINKIIKETKLKDNPDYSAYSFRSKKHRERYEATGELPSAITSIYNENAVRFILSQLGD